MARRVFFSFHYQEDVQRAQVVRNSWVTKPERDDAGFFDASVFESRQRTSDDALKRFLREGLSGSSVTCVLTGSQTASRRWVRYELLRSFVDGRGLMGVSIHGIRNLRQQQAFPGANPFAQLGGEVRNGTLYFKEHDGTKWVWARDITSMSLHDVAYDLRGRTNFTFDAVFPTYDWVSNQGYANLGVWVASAATAAGR